MLYEGISRQQLADAARTAIIAANTLAGSSVFEPRDWPNTLADFPMVIVSTPRERKTSLGRNNREFNTVISLAIIARVAATSDEKASTDLRTLTDQLENAIIVSPALSATVQQFVSIEMASAVTAESEYHVGEAGLIFECEVYQIYGPDTGTALTDVRATITNQTGGGTLTVADATL